MGNMNTSRKEIVGFVSVEDEKAVDKLYKCLIDAHKSVIRNNKIYGCATNFPTLKCIDPSGFDKLDQVNCDRLARERLIKTVLECVHRKRYRRIKRLAWKRYEIYKIMNG